MKAINLTFTNPNSAIQLTEDQANQLGIDVSQDEIRGNLKTWGVWQIPVSYKAICVSAKYGQREGYCSDMCIEKTVYGVRTMTNVKQGGYELEGYVSVNGKKYSCFTSSQLFEVNNKLINVAVIHARVR